MIGLYRTCLFRTVYKFNQGWSIEGEFQWTARNGLYNVDNLN